MGEKIPSGIPGLDDILNGGIEKGWCYLIKGGPGSGKTIFGLQFLMEGVRNGEKSVYISFDEIREEVERQAENFRWDLSEVHFVDKVSEMDILSTDLPFLDYESLAEIQSIINSIVELKELKDADRVFIDGIGIIRDMVKDPAIYRRIMSSIINYFNRNKITTMISEEFTEIGRGVTSYLTSGEFVLDKVERNDGGILRTLDVVKFRSDYVHLGRHYFEITPNGIVVYPIIPPKISEKRRVRRLISTGSKELDKMLDGGIYEGSTLLITGKTGVGKTNIGLQILMENDKRGEVGVLYVGDETEDVILKRYQELFGYEPEKIVIREFTSHEMSLGKFYNIFTKDFEELKPTVIMVDPLNILQRVSLSENELIRFLKILKDVTHSLGLITVATYEVTKAADVFHFTGAGVSFFADYLLLGRHVEIDGEIQKILTVVKNRFGDHERMARILNFERGVGVRISEPLKSYTGLMGVSLTKKGN